MEDPIRQAAHLGVTALARVFAKSLGKGDYLLERLHDGFVESTPTAVALEPGERESHEEAAADRIHTRGRRVVCPGR